MGGSTAYNALVARPDLYAEGVCISGIPPEEYAARIRGKPHWIIHGNKDEENPIAGDQALYSQLRGHQRTRYFFGRSKAASIRSMHRSSWAIYCPGGFFTA